jgi:long-chain fatty acid transport protein
LLAEDWPAILTAPTSRVGIAYRSRIKHDVNGNATFSNPELPPPFNALTASAQNMGAKTNITVPDSLSISEYFELGNGFSLLGDVTWTDWSVLRELRIQFADGSPDSVTPAHWRNTTRVAVGAGYDPNENWRIRTGFAYEPSTIGDVYRTARVPDKAQTLVAAGLSYFATRRFTVDFAYAHVFERRASISDSVPGAGQLVGSFKVSADVVGAQLRYKY